MKRALLAALILLAGGMAGCAGDDETGGAYRHYSSYSTGWSPQSPRRTHTRSIETGSLPPARPQPAPPRETPQLSHEQVEHDERRVYAQGLEKILIANGVSVSVLVYDGPVAPTPTLIFLGHFSKDFVSRALTNGAVLARAKELGFKSVDFFDRGPDGHYQFVLSQTAPLPKCAAYQRLCL